LATDFLFAPIRSQGRVAADAAKTETFEEIEITPAMAMVATEVLSGEG
jgi:hypothetical protein